MSETAVATEAAHVASTPKKSDKGKAAGGAKKIKSKPTHPKTSDMVNAAIKSLNERGGSSLQAIKKYISSNYKVDAEKLAPFIRNYLKSAVTSGSLVQTKGKGASGSFKLSMGEKAAAKKISKPSAPKSGEAKAKKATKTSAKKESVKKITKSAAKTKPSTPSKAKKAKKVPTKKPKAPKPKKVGAAKPKTVKKAAPKKK